jgi:hypothetical protein
MKLYLIPEEDITRIEEARLQLVIEILTDTQLPLASNTTQSMYHLTHRKYKWIEVNTITNIKTG